MDEIKMTTRKLQLFFWGNILVALFIVIVNETMLSTESGLLAGDDAHIEFVLVMIMELLTLAIVPLALRLTKIKRVAQYMEQGLAKYMVVALLRNDMLAFPMIINTILYYVYMKPSFGYMAIILLLCMPFIYPSRSRVAVESGNDIAQ